MDGRANNKGIKGNRGGSPGYGASINLLKKIDKFEDTWWEILEEMIRGDDKQDRRIAFTEYNKLQTKRIPQDITTGGKEIMYLPTALIDKNGINKKNTTNTK